MLPRPPVMLITDAAQAVLPLETIIDQTLMAGCRWIMLRDHAADDRSFLTQAQRIQIQCKNYEARFFISRRAAIAKQIGADGIHLSATQNIKDVRALCGSILIGQSCHNSNDVADAQKSGTDYVSLSPIFEAQSKPGYGPALGLERLAQICSSNTLPIIALGGINAKNAAACQRAGAKGIAIMGEMMRSADPLETMRLFLSHN